MAEFGCIRKKIHRVLNKSCPGLEKVILCLPAYAKVSNFTPSSGVKWVNCLHKPTNLTPSRGIKNKVTPNNYQIFSCFTNKVTSILYSFLFLPYKIYSGQI